LVREGDYRSVRQHAWRNMMIVACLWSLLLYTMISAFVQPATALATETNNSMTETTQGSTDGQSTPSTGDNFLGLQVFSAFLIEAETGQVLYEYNADQPWEPASMVKMMTEYLVLEAIAQGKFDWDSIVVISKKADATGGSGQLLAEGHKYRVRDLFNQMSIFSANDASVALAEYVAGTEELFVDMMNEKAREFGLSEYAHFSNATGLPNELYGDFAPNTSGTNQMTARDAAKIAQRLLKDHPEILQFSSKPQEYRREGDTSTELMDNWNRMLESWIPIGNLWAKMYAYEGMDGLKTGHTNSAGYNFTGTAVRNGLRLISVVMRAENEDMRFGETRKLLDYGFNNFERRTVISAKTEMEELPSVKIKRGKSLEVPLVTQSGLELIMKKEETNDVLEITAEPVDEEQLVAPIKQGDVLGTLTVKYGKDVVHTINLVAAEDVEKAGWLTLFFRAIGNFFKDIWNSILNIF